MRYDAARGLCSLVSLVNPNSPRRTNARSDASSRAIRSCSRPLRRPTPSLRLRSVPSARCSTTEQQITHPASLQREGQTHSTESWRGYYQKTGTKLVDRWVRRYEEKYKQQGKGLPDTDDESTDSDEDPSDFNTEDEGLLLAQLVKGKINQRDANSTFEKLAILVSRHHPAPAPCDEQG